MSTLNRILFSSPGQRQKCIILTITVIFAVFVTWAAIFELDEVAVGPGRVIPSSKTQLVQSVQGGRVIELLVHEGEVVEEGQILAVLDTTRIQAEIDEIEAVLKDSKAQHQMFRALLAGEKELTLTKDIGRDLSFVRQKTALFLETRSTQLQAVADLENELELFQKEFSILERASSLGAGTKIERLRLQQKIAATLTQLNSQRQNYKSDLQVELDEVSRTIQQARIRLVAQNELLRANELRSPRRGIVQDILVSTAGGGVLSPNGTVMEIVPIEEKLLIEAKFSPRDIAFLAPGQSARIKVTAYDFSIYGDLEAKVLRVSPDSFQDEMDSGLYYFSVTLESKRTYFETKQGDRYPIIPGMVTTTEVLTGKRTILQYLLKPLSKAAQSLRER